MRNNHFFLVQAEEGELNLSKINLVTKRDGRVVPFTQARITNAIYRAAVAVGGRDKLTAQALSDQVVAMLESTYAEGRTPTVEEIQDVVEKVLIENRPCPGRQGLHPLPG